MEHYSGQLADVPLLRVIRDVYLERRTGILEVHVDEQARRFFFLAGELHLTRTNPVAERILGERREGEDFDLTTSKELRQLLGRIGCSLAAWKSGRFVFMEGGDGIPSDLVGPLPTDFLLMEGAVHNCNEFELLRMLGGDKSVLVANLGGVTGARNPSIDSQEAFLLSRLERPTALTALLQQSNLAREAALRKLCRLQAVDLVRTTTPRSASPSQVTTDEVVEKFIGRIGHELEEEPLDVPAHEHRRQVADLLALLGELDFYQLLEIGPAAAEEEIRRAYTRLARIVHPSHSQRLGLEGKESALRVLFERVTEAYLSLSDPIRRQEYNRLMGIRATSSQEPSIDREAEKAKLAGEYLTRARALLAAEDYYQAGELLRQATQLEPTAEAYALLGEVQSKNPHWLHHAIRSYRQALKLEPHKLELRISLARLLEETGEVEGAQAEYAAVLERMPSQPDAVAAMARLSQPEKPTRQGLFRRLFGSHGEDD